MIISDSKDSHPLIFKPAFKLSILGLCSLLLITVLLWVPGLLSSFLLALIFVFILSPAVDFIERRGVSRSKSILIVLLALLVTMVLTGMLLSNLVLGEYEDFASQIDFYSSMINDEINRRVGELEGKFGLGRFDFGERILAMGQSKVRQALLFTGATFGTVLTWMVIVPLALFFFLLDGYRIKRAVIGFLPNRYFEMSLNIHQKINQIVGGFIRAKLIESLVVGSCVLTGFIVVGMVFQPIYYMVFLAITVGLFNIIPYLGPAIGAIPVLLVAIVQYVLLPQFPEYADTAEYASSWAPVLAIVCVLAFAQLVDNVYLIPVLLGRSVNVHPLIVLLAVILGAKMLGIIGMIISIPLASIIQTMIFEVSESIRHLRH
ncbi:MAG: AI-2E family transporter [Candidatus Glassbacteria bacterium]|nr:AI-2E family transporter [Candidatus Glassbacteria bacterium]